MISGCNRCGSCSPLPCSRAPRSPVHGAARERWGLDASRVVQFKSIGPDGAVDRKPQLTLGAPNADALVVLPRPGGYLFAFQSSPSRSALPFVRFNDYVAEEGLTSIALDRKRRNAERAEGRELYSRRAKTIVQVGPLDTASAVRVTRVVGLELEIVPGVHPQAVPVRQPMPLRIFWKGRPLAGALVKLTDLDADAKPVAVLRSNSDGHANVVLPRKGNWQVNVIWSEPLPPGAGAEYRTVFSSLSFAN